MHPHILYNDKIVPATQPILRAGQLGALSGWGVFTTLRIYQGIPFAFDRHWARMSRDAALIHVDLPFDPEEVRSRLLRLVERNGTPEASLRLCILRSERGVFAGPGEGNPSDLVAFSIDVRSRAETATLTVREHGRHAASPFAGAKILSWAHNLTMVEEAQQAGFDEVILLNERGEVAECTSANIFAVRDGVILTPPLSAGPLPGVTRAVMIEELDDNDAEVREAVLRLEDLLGADEVFITSSTRELLPIVRINDQPLPEGPWPTMERARKALRAYVNSYIEAAKTDLH